jgi:hypothetical protein
MNDVKEDSKDQESAAEEAHEAAEEMGPPPSK